MAGMRGRVAPNEVPRGVALLGPARPSSAPTLAADGAVQWPEEAPAPARPRPRAFAFWAGQLVGWGVYGLTGLASLLFMRRAGIGLVAGPVWGVFFGLGLSVGQALFWTWLLREYYVRRLPAAFDEARPLRPYFRAAVATLAASLGWAVGDTATFALAMRAGLVIPHSLAVRSLANVGLAQFAVMVAYGFTTYAAALLVWNGLYWGGRFASERAHEKRRSRTMARQARDAQFQMLRYQLNPHFLFNALNSLRGLMAEDVARAQQLTVELADFLRYSLAQSAETFVAVRDELDAVRAYAAVEAVRFEEKLRFAIEVDDAALGARVPSFLLHPLVENAVKYGMQTSPMPLRVALRVAARGGRLQIEVTNTGRWVDPGERAGGAPGTGIGLGNVRERLRHAYPRGHRFSAESRGGEVRVRLELPCDVAAPAAGEGAPGTSAGGARP